MRHHRTGHRRRDLHWPFATTTGGTDSPPRGSARTSPTVSRAITNRSTRPRPPQLGLKGLHPLPSGAFTLLQQPHHRRHPGTSTEETTRHLSLPPKHRTYT
ncbi:hypothetical protein ACFQV4_25715 [Streptomyces thermocarboxydus]